MLYLAVILSKITERECINERYPPFKSKNLTCAILRSHLSNS